MFQTILVPTDGSRNAAKAVAIASDLAAKYEAKLILLHVIEGGEVPEGLRRFVEVENLPRRRGARRVEHLEATPQGPVPLPGGTAERVDRHAVRLAVAERVLEEAKYAAEQRGVARVELVTEEGDPPDQILETAKRQGADAIVMGSRGLSDLQGVLLGSVSHKVSHRAACTCVTVH